MIKLKAIKILLFYFGFVIHKIIQMLFLVYSKWCIICFEATRKDFFFKRNHNFRWAQYKNIIQINETVVAVMRQGESEWHVTQTELLLEAVETVIWKYLKCGSEERCVTATVSHQTPLHHGGYVSDPPCETLCKKLVLHVKSTWFFK